MSMEDLCTLYNWQLVKIILKNGFTMTGTIEYDGLDSLYLVYRGKSVLVFLDQILNIIV